MWLKNTVAITLIAFTLAIIGFFVYGVIGH